MSGAASLSLPILQSHIRIVSKASQMVDDLKRLYKFGVDMDLLGDDEELDSSLDSLKGMFQRSCCTAVVRLRDNRR
jgi:hypothetical protein